ncbi:hypothetical protein M0R89_09650 [Halorussus limi]|uniref:DUF7344 domain-containing protein n=1 Tax=Halorussus limi TaxID=2938695 RepID=A0A8U0HPZ3_9EURY|nr:hypothetical protein [Halorussus limi]UPV72813.1 hypothetical protein M0R89_09650 [Halorussus limi]
MSDDEFNQGRQQETPVVSDGGTSLPTRIFGALAHQRRRCVLYYLRDHEQASIDDLASHLTVFEQDIPRNEMTPEAIKQVKTTLVQIHLPKLDDYGLIDYDRRSETVCCTYAPDLLDDALDIAATIDNYP